MCSVPAASNQPERLMVGHDRPGAAGCSILAPIDRLPALDEDARQLALTLASQPKRIAAGPNLASA